MKMQLAHNISSVKGHYPHTYQHHSQLLTNTRKEREIRLAKFKRKHAPKANCIGGYKFGAFAKQEWGDNAPDGEMSTKRKAKVNKPGNKRTN